MKFLVVISALAVAANGAPQLLYGGYGLGAVHAVPTVAKQTITYKTAAFEAVDAATPADAQLIALKETEHSHDILVPGPVKYVHTPAVATYAGYPYAGVYGGLGLPLAAAPAVAEEAAVEAVAPAVATYAGYPYAGVYGGLGLHGGLLHGGLAGYPYAGVYGGLGLPVLAAAPAAAVEAAVEAVAEE